MARNRGKRPSGKRSRLEEKVAELLPKNVGYETVKLNYTVPASQHTYKPDFVISNNKVCEVKGYFPYKDRKKMLCVRESNPDVTIYMLFENAYKPITKGSKTTYADWCKANGFEWAQFPDVPEHWLEMTPVIE